MRSLSSARLLVLFSVLGACSGEMTGATAGSGGQSGGDTMTQSCISDPDLPTTCTFWTCENVPAAFANKIRCTANQPPRSPQPSGSYTCPETGGGLSCPGSGSGGTGSWNCTAT